jgi:hypothetical protein
MLKIRFHIIILTLCSVSSFTNVYGQGWDIFTTSTSYGYDFQLGLGVSTLYQPNLTQPPMGLNLKFRLEAEDIRIAGEDNKTFFIFGVNYFFKQEKTSEGNFNAVPINASLFDPILVPFQNKQTVSYLMFDFGIDYYLFTNKKESFSFYGGWLVGLITPFYNGNYQIDTYDQMNYILQTEPDWVENFKSKESVFKAGINLGFDFYVGDFSSLYFETSPYFSLPAEKKIPSDFTINSRFFLAFNFGFRYEF